MDQVNVEKEECRRFLAQKANGLAMGGKSGPQAPPSPQLYDAAFEGSLSDVEDALSGSSYAVPDVNARCPVRNAFCWQKTALELAVVGNKNRANDMSMLAS